MTLESSGQRWRGVVVGCGGAGAQHARGFATSPLAELVGVCDLDARRAETVAERHGCRAFTDLDTMLAAVQPTVASVATRELLHHDPVVTALRAGCHVYCEKIMAGTREEGRSMLRAAAEAERVLAVGYNYRHFGVFKRLRQMIDEGELGEVGALFCTTHRFCWHHVLDLSRFLLGDVVEVSAVLDDDPAMAVSFWPRTEEMLYIPSRLASATLTFASGARAVIHSSGHQPFHYSLIDLRLIGSKGAIDVQRITVDDLVGRVEASVPWPGPAAGPTTLDDSFVFSLHAFVEALADGRPAPTDGRDGMAVMGIEHAVVQSAALKQSVVLSPTSGAG